MHKLAAPSLAQDYPLVADRAAWTEASELMVLFGEHAQLEAAVRAHRSRTIGNLIDFCRWRSIERAIEVLSNEQAIGTIH
jgi:hypothetical protein